MRTPNNSSSKDRVISASIDLKPQNWINHLEREYRKLRDEGQQWALRHTNTEQLGEEMPGKRTGKERHALRVSRQK